MYHTSEQNIQIFDIIDFMYCQHVYKDVLEDPCPFCGGDTHKTDWKLQAKLHKKWKEENPDAAKYGGWWSI